MRAIWTLAACFLIGMSASGAPAGVRELAVTPVAENRALDKLFEQLKNAGNATEARAITELIWRHWFQHPNGAVTHLMNRAQLARRAGQYTDALAELDKIVELAPDYSEGWNQRATVLFMLGRDAESVADIQKVLRLEPRHFGALSGLGLIHIRAKNWRSAIASIERALGRFSISQNRWVTGIPKSVGF